jgi:hypothetical protein
MVLPKLSDEERLLHEQELIDRLIEQHNRKRGYAESIMVENGASVWVRIHDWLSVGDLARVKKNWDLTDEALIAEIAYYRRHKQVIDARIALEEDAWHDPR